MLTGSLEFLEVKGFRGSQMSALARSELAGLPSAWSIVGPDQSASGHVEVLVGIGSTVVALDALGRMDQVHSPLSSSLVVDVDGQADFERVAKGSFTHIVPSPNGRFLALTTISDTLWVVSADFARSLSEVDISEYSQGAGAPDQAEWCGDNAVVLRWGGKIVVVGPNGDNLRWVSLLAHLYVYAPGKVE